MNFSVREINWDYVGDSVPAFLTLIMIPLTYKYVPSPFFPSLSDLLVSSIAYGVIAGVASYALLNLLPALIKLATKGAIEPPLYAHAEKWHVPPGGFRPLWMRNAMRGNWRVWEEDGAEQEAVRRMAKEMGLGQNSAGTTPAGAYAMSVTALGDGMGGGFVPAHPPPFVSVNVDTVTNSTFSGHGAEKGGMRGLPHHLTMPFARDEDSEFSAKRASDSEQSSMGSPGGMVYPPRKF